jgi:hypothetical protein
MNSIEAEVTGGLTAVLKMTPGTSRWGERPSELAEYPSISNSEQTGSINRSRGNIFPYVER